MCQFTLSLVDIDSHSCLSAGARASQDSKSTVVLSDREHMAVPGSLLQTHQKTGRCWRNFKQDILFTTVIECLLFSRLQSVEAAAHGEREKASEKEKASKICAM